MAITRKLLTLFILLSIFALSFSIVEAVHEPNTSEIEVEVEPKIPVIVKLKSGLDTDTLYQSASFAGDIKYKYNYFNGFAAKVTEQELQELQNNPNVEAVHRDELFKIALDSSAIQVNATRVWNLQYNSENITGKDQTVCVVDTGVNYSHFALGSCTNDSFLAGTCAKVVGGYDLFNEDSDPADDQGHGTHITGIVASSDSTYKGIAPDAKVYAVKVLDSTGSGYASDVAKGIDICAGNASEYNISAIIMSFVAIHSNGTEKKYISTSTCDNEGGTTGLVVKAANDAAANGIFVAAASGNSGYSDGIGLPACGSNVTSVSAVDNSDADGGYNIGDLLDLFAPGVTIMSTEYTGGFDDNSGTSMAAPHVAGAALLMQQYELLESSSSILPEELTNIFKNTGKIISTRGLDIPRIDIKAAIEAIDNTSPATISTLDNTSAGFSNITISWANPLDTDFNHVEIWADGIFKGNSSTNEYTVTGLLANTEYEIQIKTVDESLNVNDTFVGINATTLVDNELPSIFLISPENNSNISQGEIIDLDASDNGEIVSLWYSKNSEANQTLTSPYDIDTAAWTSGDVYLTVSAEDMGNNVNTTEFFFVVNSSAPSAINVKVLPLDATTSSNLICNYTYFDPDSNPENNTIINWYTNGNENSSFENLTQISNVNTTRNQKWNCSVTPHDGAAYGATVTSDETEIQNAAPTATVTYPDGGEEISNTTNITWTASDADTDNITYFVYYSADSGTGWTLISGCSNITLLSCTWDTSAVDNGNDYRAGVNVTDIFGAATFDMSDDDFDINNTVSNGTNGNGGNGGDDGGDDTADDEVAAGGGAGTTAEEETIGTAEAEEITNETATEIPEITGSAIADFLKGNAGTALVVGFVIAAIMAGLVLFAKKGKLGKFPRVRRRLRRRY